jgi:hypothetical protein
MHILEEHRSPDGLLKLLIGQSDNGDITLGFDGFAWHTHADILASHSGLSETVAVKRFVDDLLNSKAIIAVARTEGIIRDVWVTDAPRPDKYKPVNETLEFRYWDGRSAV